MNAEFERVVQAYSDAVAQHRALIDERSTPSAEAILLQEQKIIASRTHDPALYRQAEAALPAVLEQHQHKAKELSRQIRAAEQHIAGLAQDLMALWRKRREPPAVTEAHSAYESAAEQVFHLTKRIPKIKSRLQAIQAELLPADGRLHVLLTEEEQLRQAELHSERTALQSELQNLPGQLGHAVALQTLAHLHLLGAEYDYYSQWRDSIDALVKDRLAEPKSADILFVVRSRAVGTVSAATKRAAEWYGARLEDSASCRNAALLKGEEAQQDAYAEAFGHYRDAIGRR